MIIMHLEAASMKELLSSTVASWGKKKVCRHCRSTTNAEAPCCDACGFDFTATPVALRFQAPWKGRIIAAGTGLVAVGTVWLLRP